jgi:hypothetical protein
MHFFEQFHSKSGHDYFLYLCLCHHDPWLPLGYEYPDDPYILAGSCGLEYKLEGGGSGGSSSGSS